MDDFSDGEMSEDGLTSSSRRDVFRESDVNIGGQGVVPSGLTGQGFRSYREVNSLSSSESGLLYEDGFAFDRRLPCFREGLSSDSGSENGFGRHNVFTREGTSSWRAQFVERVSVPYATVRESDSPLPGLTRDRVRGPPGSYHIVGTDRHGEIAPVFAFRPVGGGSPVFFTNEPVWDDRLGRWLSRAPSRDHRGFRGGDTVSFTSEDAGQVPPSSPSEDQFSTVGANAYMDFEQFAPPELV